MQCRGPSSLSGTVCLARLACVSEGLQVRPGRDRRHGWCGVLQHVHPTAVEVYDAVKLRTGFGLH